MNNNETEAKIIDNYKQDEQMMILIFAQWCVNHDLDPAQMYMKAYPNQLTNYSLTQAIELTVPKDEAGDIADDTLLGVLSLFGNEDLAQIVIEQIANRN